MDSLGTQPTQVRRRQTRQVLVFVVTALALAGALVLLSLVASDVTPDPSEGGLAMKVSRASP
jgi:hypothetical protein